MPQHPTPCCCQRCQEAVGMTPQRPHIEAPDAECVHQPSQRQPPRRDEHGQPLQELFED